MAYLVSVSIVCDTQNCKREFKCEATGFNYIPKAKAEHEAEMAGWYMRNAYARCPDCNAKFIDELGSTVSRP